MKPTVPPNIVSSLLFRSAQAENIGSKPRCAPVSGLLGKTDIDGTTNSNPISHLIPHLNSALQKPAADERLIFIDLNTEPTAGGGKPAWIEKAATRLEQYEQKELAAGLHAYVFITNMAFHRMLNEAPQFAGVPLVWVSLISTGQGIVGCLKPTA